MKASRKAIALRSLTDYFLEKGEIMDSWTYTRQDDTPVPPRTVKRLIGNWSRIPKMIKVNYPEDYDKITGVVPEVEPEVELKVEPEVEAEPLFEEVDVKLTKLEAVKARAAEYMAKIEVKDEE